MARATVELIRVLRVTAARLEGSVSYQWGHMGECNCGHLAQTITKLGRAPIHQGALEREGDWEQQARDYCPQSGLLIDDIITEMLELGMTTADIGRLERLSDAQVLAELRDGEPVHLRRNRREDVVRYMRAWADLLESQLPGLPASKRAA